MADFDVIVIGAGISGVNAGYRIQESLPDSTYAILESRHEIGGTWSLFKYPGIRSDSDLHTFGFAFDPWKAENPIATAPSILSYLNDVASRHGIDKHIKFHHSVQSLDFRSDEQKWKLEVLVNGSEKKTFYANYIIMGTGYYDYNQVNLISVPSSFLANNPRASRRTSPASQTSRVKSRTRNSGPKTSNTKTRSLSSSARAPPPSPSSPPCATPERAT
jgi:cation diffusion facilitator CzcD-associated flavoprotein CzcO